MRGIGSGVGRGELACPRPEGAIGIRDSGSGIRPESREPLAASGCSRRRRLARFAIAAVVLAVVASGATGQDDAQGVEATPLASTLTRGPEEILLAALDAYEEGRYEESIAALEGLLARGFDDGRLHYDLGNALLRDGQLGRAIASYRRAVDRRPRDGDAIANLAFARRQARDAIDPPAAPVIARTLFFWHFALAPSELRWILVAANAVAWLLAVAVLLRRRWELVRWVCAGAFLLVLAVALSVVADWAFVPRTAVVVPAEIEALAGPADDAVVRFALHAGSEVRVVEARGEWLRVALPDGQQGWLPREAAEVVAAWRG